MKVKLKVKEKVDKIWETKIKRGVGNKGCDKYGSCKIEGTSMQLEKLENVF